MSELKGDLARGGYDGYLNDVGASLDAEMEANLAAGQPAFPERLVLARDKFLDDIEKSKRGETVSDDGNSMFWLKAATLVDPLNDPEQRRLAHYLAAREALSWMDRHADPNAFLQQYDQQDK